MTIIKNVIKQHLKNKFEKMDPQRKKTLAKTIVNVIQRFISVVARFIFMLMHGEHGKVQPPIRNLILLESATSLAHKIRTRKLTSVEVLQAFIDRINEINEQLNCVVDERFEDALKDAAAADSLIASGKFTVDELAQDKPFLGVPITTKDCIKVKDMIHSAGLYKRRNIYGDVDSDVIHLMREKGAIPLAITNVSECCMWWESVNTVHGRTRNPYDDNRIVGGSSGGEGCLQGACGSAFGIGSDIGGSIRMPAFFNGVFGHKPTKDVVSNEGQYPKPFCAEQNSYLGIGPICRYAADLKPMLKIIADQNAAKLRLDEPVDLKNIKFFYQENDGGGTLVSPVDFDIKESLQKVVTHIKKTVQADVTKVQIKNLSYSAPIWFASLKAEGTPSFDRQIVNLEGKVNVYSEMVKWIFNKSEHTFVALMTALTEQNGVQLGTPKYDHVIGLRQELQEEFDSMLGTDGVFLYPTHPTVAPYHVEPILRALNFSYTGIINVLGLPATAIPLGLGREGLPLGIQVVAGPHQDRLCLAVACELEKAFGGWTCPEVLA